MRVWHTPPSPSNPPDHITSSPQTHADGCRWPKNKDVGRRWSQSAGQLSSPSVTASGRKLASNTSSGWRHESVKSQRDSSGQTRRKTSWKDNRVNTGTNNLLTRAATNQRLFSSSVNLPIISSINRLVIWSETREKCPLKYSTAQCETDQTPKYSIYYKVRPRKAADSHIWEAWTIKKKKIIKSHKWWK